MHATRWRGILLLAILGVTSTPGVRGARGDGPPPPEGTTELVEAIRRRVAVLGASRVEVLAPNPGGANLTLTSPGPEGAGATILRVDVMVGTRDPQSAEATFASRKDPGGSKQWRRHGNVGLDVGKTALLDVYERRGQSWQGHATCLWRGSLFRGVAFCEFTVKYVAPTPVPPGEDARAAQAAWAASQAASVEQLAHRLYEALGQAETMRGPQIELVILDPNPAPLGGDGLESRPFTEHFWIASITGSKLARGACADGASLLLLRARVPAAGRVRFELRGEGELGGLFPLEKAADPLEAPVAPSLEMEAMLLPEPGGLAGVALYRPPRDFGEGKGPRGIELFVRFAPADGKAPLLTASTSFKLIRPPVVLVHGTYDNPDDCWRTLSPGGNADHLRTMEQCLLAEGFRPFTLDYGATSGNANPSAPLDNAYRIWAGRDGINPALRTLRAEGFAATRADLVCHSLGGLLARLFVAKVRGARESNYRSTDVNRVITLCSTHRGSEVMGLFAAYDAYQTSSYTPAAFWTSLFLGGLDRLEQRITTEAPVAQVPGSPFLRSLGATRVRAHAIACVAADADLAQYGGLYARRGSILWSATTREAIREGIGIQLGRSGGAKELLELYDEQERAQARVSEATRVTHAGTVAPPPELVAAVEEVRRRGISALRRIVFDGPNDCTVSEVSARGGLAPPYATTIPGVLHGFAPQYPAVQARVVELLRSKGDTLFTPEGFPAAYP